MTRTYSRTPGDGDVVRTMANGIRIIRRLKHEWQPKLNPSDAERFRRFTDPIRGSKFLSTQSYDDIAQLTEAAILAFGWQVDNSPCDSIIAFEHDIGYSNGILVKRVRVEMSSGFAHAYPVE